jgi:hypothetical protein
MHPADEAVAALERARNERRQVAHSDECIDTAPNCARAAPNSAEAVTDALTGLPLAIRGGVLI